MQTMMKRRWDGSLLLKLALAAMLVLLGDVVFWQWQQALGVQGLFMLGLCAALLAARPAVRKDRRAWIALGLAALYALAQLWDPSPLAFALFWIAIGMATLLPATARFDDGWHWLQRLVAHGFKALFGPLIDLIILGKLRRKRPAGPLGLRRAVPLLALPLAGGAVFVALFAQANPVIAALVDQLRLPAFDWTLLPRMLLWGLFALLGWGVLRAPAAPPARHARCHRRSDAAGLLARLDHAFAAPVQRAVCGAKPDGPRLPVRFTGATGRDHAGRLCPPRRLSAGRHRAARRAVCRGHFAPRIERRSQPHSAPLDRRMDRPERGVGSQRRCANLGLC